MIEVYSRLFVGHQGDYDNDVSGRTGWAVVHACKEPYHRQALGYRSQGAPKGHPEYLIFGTAVTRYHFGIVATPPPRTPARGVPTIRAMLAARASNGAGGWGGRI